MPASQRRRSCSVRSTPIRTTGPESLERRACPTVVSVSAPLEVAETAGQTEFVVTLSAPGARSTIVPYTFREGPSTATFGRDYQVFLASDGRSLPAAGQIVFRPGEMSHTLRVAIMDDGIPEGPEAFTLSLLRPRGATLGASAATVTILGDGGSAGGPPANPGVPGVPEVSVTGPGTVAESQGTSRIVVSLSQPSRKPVTVGYSLQSAYASASFNRDYWLQVGTRRLPAVGTLTFSPGQTSQVIDLILVNDVVREGDEHFTFTLQRPSGAVLDRSASSSLVTILDDDAYTPSFTGPSRITAGGSFDYVFQLSSPATRREVFYLSTSDGTALATEDYRPLKRIPVVIDPGGTSATVKVLTVADTVPEYDENFFLVVEPRSADFPAPPPFEVVIVGELGPRPPELAFTGSLYVGEGDAGLTEVVLTATLSGIWSEAISVQYVTRDGSATVADNDYVATGGTLSFAPGERSKTVTVAVVGDTKAERGESFFVDLVNPRNVLLTSSSVVVTIVNDDDRPAESDYDNEYGYGLVDASAAVAHHLGLPGAFPAVPDLGGREWGNDLVKSPAVWAQGITGRGIVVAVIDTGVDFTHPDLYLNIWINQGEIPAALRPQLVDVDRDGIVTFRDLNAPANSGFVRDVNRNGYIDGGDLLGDTRWVSGRDADANGFRADLIGWNFVGRNSRPTDYDTHGTHVAGTIGAMRNSIGHTGVAHDALIMPIASLGRQGGSNADVAAGIRYAADNGAHVINLSLGGPSSRTVEDAVTYATSRGAVVVAAAGNDAGASPGFPARLATLPGVISVGAVDRTGTIADFSHWAGPNPAMKHVMGPGVDVFSTIPGGRYANYPGTSMATPHVAGVVALMLSARGTTDALGRDAVVDALVDTSSRGAGAGASVNRAALFAAIGNLPGRMFPASTATDAAPPRSRFSLLLDSARG